jgi:NDP-sugar pyrophosphorylase family protein
LQQEQENKLNEFPDEEPTKGFENLGLITIMGAKVPNDEKKYFGLLALDKNTNEVLHYAENSDIKISDIANWGVYFISVRIFAEYGMCPY